MATENKKKPAAATAGHDNVVQIASNCKCEGCKKKASRANFCDEHFVWFKEGLITKEGVRPRDFDKKHQDWMARKAA